MTDKEQQLREQLEELKFRTQTTREEIEETNRAISDITSEIETMTQDAMLEALSNLEHLKVNGNPFIGFILYLYQHPNYLEQVLASSKADCWLYVYRDIIFPVPAGFKIDLPLFDEVRADKQESKESRQEQHKASSASEPIIKPYGNSWFSPEAHRSIQKLRAEYKALAKQYHPDHCHHAQSTQIFQEILNERAEILEKMEE